MNENLELIYQEVKDRLKDQLLSIDQTTTKFSILLGFNGVIIAILAQNIASNKGLGLFLEISLILFFVSIVLGLRGLIIRKYRRDPNPRSLYNIYKTDELEETKDTLINNFIESFEENQRKLEDLIKIFISSLSVTVAAIVFIIVYLFKEGVILLWLKTITNL